MTDNLYCNIAHSPIQHIICNRNVFTNFLPCSHTINPNTETCLVTCAVSLTCATWLTVCTHSFSFDLPLNQDTSVYVGTFRFILYVSIDHPIYYTDIHMDYVYVCMYVCISCYQPVHMSLSTCSVFLSLNPMEWS